MTLFQKKYRVESNRFMHHSYNEGTYFVTICTKKKLQWFGEIKKGKMLYSELGEVTKRCIESIVEHFPNTTVNSWCLMPDHLHLILRLENVETQNFASLPSTTIQRSTKGNFFGPQSRNLGSVIRGLKIGVKKYANVLHPDFQWQPRYHDRIIRSAEELAAIKKYIAKNPDAWDKETIPWHADGTAWFP